MVNLYGCTIGSETEIGAFVEIQKGVQVGALCKSSSHSFICAGMTIEDDVIVGHGVMFINDCYPHATTEGGLQTESDWQVIPTRVKQRASLGSNETILCDVTIGMGAMVGAGAAVTKRGPAHAIVVVAPARVIGKALQ